MQTQPSTETEAIDWSDVTRLEVVSRYGLCGPVIHASRESRGERKVAWTEEDGFVVNAEWFAESGVNKNYTVRIRPRIASASGAAGKVNLPSGEMAGVGSICRKRNGLLAKIKDVAAECKVDFWNTYKKQWSSGFERRSDGTSVISPRGDDLVAIATPAEITAAGIDPKDVEEEQREKQKPKYPISDGVEATENFPVEDGYGKGPGVFGKSVDDRVREGREAIAADIRDATSRLRTGWPKTDVKLDAVFGDVKDGAAPAAAVKPGEKYVPWTFETMPVAVKVRRQRKSIDALFVAESLPNIVRLKSGYLREGITLGYGDLFDDYEQLDGMPCGIPA